MASLESLSLSRIARRLLSQPVTGQEKSDDQSSHGELARQMNRHENQHLERHDDEKVQRHISIFSIQEFDPPQRRLRDCRHSVPLRPGPVCLSQGHDSCKSLELGTCTDPERLPLMVKFASESVHTVEERQGIPSEVAQKSHMAQQATQFPSSDTSTFQKNIGALLRMRPKRSTVGRVRNCLTLSSKPRG